MSGHSSRLWATRFRAIVTWLVVAFIAVACAPAGSEPVPPDIAYGHDICEQCGMMIDDPRFAAAMLLENGQTLKFDDAGEMFAYHVEHPDQPVRAWFVHDYEDQSWLRGENAFYVVNEKVHSPMGTGVAAFVRRPAAEKLAQDLGTSVLTFEEARKMLRIAKHQ
ncbi:MAG: nitrous oxide reductase accessory protein NosL [Chloroflexi bacterium]|nr:nitrous oxide reductase accessory protein NosL [Chloroflexota bacterium]